jgi:hypothetical protein
MELLMRYGKYHGIPVARPRFRHQLYAIFPFFLQRIKPGVINIDIDVLTPQFVDDIPDTGIP